MFLGLCVCAVGQEILLIGTEANEYCKIYYGLLDGAKLIYKSNKQNFG